MYTDPKECVDLTMLGLVGWREARGTLVDGTTAMLAVMCSIENRVAHPSWWGHTLLEVITKRFQYSSIAAPGDPQLTVWPTWSDESWATSLRLAGLVLKGIVTPPAPGADSYFDDSIRPPAWAKPEMFVCKIGRLNFYNLDRDHEAEEMKTAQPAARP